MRARIDLRSTAGALVFVVGILWLWWAYVASTMTDVNWTSGSVWLRVAGGVALLVIGLSIWFVWRPPRP